MCVVCFAFFLFLVFLEEKGGRERKAGGRSRRFFFLVSVCLVIVSCVFGVFFLCLCVFLVFFRCCLCVFWFVFSGGVLVGGFLCVFVGKTRQVGRLWASQSLWVVDVRLRYVCLASLVTKSTFGWHP